MLAFAWQVMQVTVFFLWKPSLFLFSLSGVLLGWWYCPCVCCGSQRCYRLSFNWCKWSLWGIRTVSCARNIRLSPGSQGLYILFYCCSRNDPMIMFYISQVCLADAGSEATWKGSSNWCIIDCCWRGKLRYLFQMQSKVSLISWLIWAFLLFSPPWEDYQCKCRWKLMNVLWLSDAHKRLSRLIILASISRLVKQVVDFSSINFLTSYLVQFREQVVNFSSLRVQGTHLCDPFKWIYRLMCV